MNLGFFMCHFQWLEIWQFSAIYPERHGPWFQKVIGRKLTQVVVGHLPDFLLYENIALGALIYVYCMFSAFTAFRESRKGWWGQSMAGDDGDDDSDEEEEFSGVYCCMQWWHVQFDTSLTHGHGLCTSCTCMKIGAHTSDDVYTYASIVMRAWL